MLEGTLLGLMYVLAVCGGILGLYVVAFLIMCLIQMYRKMKNNKHQHIEHDTINDSLIVRIND
jgi:phage shock protein PspC (stress-responsive transcriptional regulator)